ncbi:hypothetical protein SAMN04488527_12131 [Aliiroseovarius crassostreae]|uniref:Uncharacterized protein n=1 Tax=Aliiroseovarius crassostreae TaxID=154981 RepID=A0A0P7J8B5_9RHOB|nr:hypothetical protein [Aliiroseovarius crassostreae]KPN64865.1 hypothetical protein AKJ29_06445 [Aliiroseovarius crassostreae]SFU83886.1 hypothetical protein SAMN04488527_12131 [Aliiroseovarius crassostreae]
MKELLDNAVLSIEFGVEDFKADDERRLLSAIRNLYAGVLLLCKQVLWNASPEGSEGSLIYKDLVPEKQEDGSVLMKPKKAHRNTIDRRQIEERFKSLDLDLDWGRLTSLANIRNDAEHLFLKATPVVAKEALASTLPLVQKLLADHLEEDPPTLLDEDVWQTLLQNSEVFEAQAAQCRKTFDGVFWGADILPDSIRFLRCPHCKSSLVRCDETVALEFENLWMDCAECNQEIDREDAFLHALAELVDSQSYLAAKNGELPSITTCPECSLESWSRYDQKCVFCNEETQTCGICGTDCDPDDYNPLDGYCSSCSYGMQKAMKDD